MSNNTNWLWLALAAAALAMALTSARAPSPTASPPPLVAPSSSPMAQTKPFISTQELELSLGEEGLTARLTNLRDRPVQVFLTAYKAQHELTLEDTRITVSNSDGAVWPDYWCGTGLNSGWAELEVGESVSVSLDVPRSRTEQRKDGRRELVAEVTISLDRQRETVRSNKILLSEEPPPRNRRVIDGDDLGNLRESRQ